jgi:hypothetical protein
MLQQDTEHSDKTGLLTLLIGIIVATVVVPCHTRRYGISSVNSGKLSDIQLAFIQQARSSN